jgi:hypothetical protein
MVNKVIHIVQRVIHNRRVRKRIDQIKAEILGSLPGIRVLLVDGSVRDVLDDETFPPGGPIIIDFQRVINAARQK